MNLEILNEAKGGNISLQKEIYDQCKKISLPITLQFTSKAKKVNLSFEDLRNLTSNAFLQALNTYDENKSDFYNYFKYIYMMECRSHIRKEAFALAKLDSFLYSESFEHLDEIEFNSPTAIFEEEKYAMYDKETLVEAIKKDNGYLSIKEKTILSEFIEGKNLKEISNLHQKNYTETLRAFKKAIKKLQIYFHQE